MKKIIVAFILIVSLFGCVACGDTSSSSDSASDFDSVHDSLTLEDDSAVSVVPDIVEESALESTEDSDCPECTDEPSNTLLCGDHTYSLVMACNIFGDLEQYSDIGLIDITECTEDALFFMISPTQYCMKGYNLSTDIEDYEGLVTNLSEFTQLFPMGYGYEDLVDKGYNPCEYDTLDSWLSDFGEGMEHTIGFKVDDNKSSDYDIILHINMLEQGVISNMSVVLSTTDKASLTTVPHAVFEDPYLCVYPLTNQGNTVYPMTFYYRKGR